MPTPAPARCETSDPPRKVSKQLFNIAPTNPRDRACCAPIPAAAARVFEVHPEVAFWRLNGGRALDRAEEGQEPALRAGPGVAPQLADRCRTAADAVNDAPPKGAGPDDLLDALACAAIARRLHRGEAKPFPDPPPRDAFGLPMAIWA